MFRIAICSPLLIVALLVSISISNQPERTVSDSVDSKKQNSSVAEVPRAKILQISNKIDELVLSALEANDQKRNPETNDETFLRRAYLDIVGRIPTYQETQRFLRSGKKNKRELLIDQLLDSYGYVSDQYNFMADLLRIKSRQQNVVGQAYIDFIKDSLQANKPYDQLVKELVTSEGPMLSRETGAVGYYLRDRNMPEDNMSNTIRVFLGTRLECAQCHDHPFDDWTQRQYYEMVAFTGGLMTRLPKPDSKYADEIHEFRNRARQMSDAQRAALRRIVEPMTFGVAGSGTGLARLPENFLGSDGEDFDIVTAKTMFEGEAIVQPEIPTGRRAEQVNKRNPQRINGAKPIDSREAYGEWLTSAENPRFAKVMANRLWKEAFGMGLIEPVDDLTKSTQASNPELMEYLTQTFVDLEFDMKQFQRAIYNSKTYQARAMKTDVTDPNKFLFNGPIVRRMSAEQIWDSLLTLTIADVDQRQEAANVRLRGLPSGGNVYESYEKVRNMTPDQILKMAESYSTDEGRMMMRKQSTQKNRAEQKQLQAQKEELAKKIRQARKDGNAKLLERLDKQKDQLMAKFRRSSGGAGQLNRASEIVSPAPAGHFLREFGQSDRETIENANSDPAVTQALSLMNGFLEKRIADNPATVLMQNVSEAKNADQAVSIVYLTMLNREPSRKEVSLWSADFKKHSIETVLSDLIWTLANTNEFIFTK